MQDIKKKPHGPLSITALVFINAAKISKGGTFESHAVADDSSVSNDFSGGQLASLANDQNMT